MVANTSLQIKCISMQNMTKRQENHDSTIVEQGRFNLRHAQEKERHTNKYSVHQHVKNNSVFLLAMLTFKMKITNRYCVHRKMGSWVKKNTVKCVL